MSFDGRFRKPLKRQFWTTGGPQKPVSKIRFARKGAPNLGFVRFPKGKLRSATRGPSRSKTHRLGPKGSAEAVSKNRNGDRGGQKSLRGEKKRQTYPIHHRIWTPGGDPSLLGGSTPPPPRPLAHPAFKDFQRPSKTLHDFPRLSQAFKDFQRPSKTP